jgi:hypothetical protein
VDRIYLEGVDLMASLLPTPEPPDPVEGALGHFEHTNWVKQALKNLDAGTVHAAAGSAGALTVDGLTVNPASSEGARIYLQGNSTKDIIGNMQSGARRWQLVLGNAVAEGGNNSGSLFQLLAFGSAPGSFPGATSGSVTILADNVDGRNGVYSLSRDTYPSGGIGISLGATPLFTAGGTVPFWPVALKSVPPGGSTGQVLKKTSNADYAAAWAT